MPSTTTLRERLEAVLEALPEERAREVLDFAEFLASREDEIDWENTDESWHAATAQGFARGFGDDEPEYTLADVKRR